MIIHLNGYPGVGKLTVGRILARRLGGRLLDNHAIYDVAFALAEFRSPAWDRLARGVRDVAFQGVEALSPQVPVITTNACSDSDWGGGRYWTSPPGAARRSWWCRWTATRRRTRAA